ncbi:MAG: PP0621 family protein [Granulosicoccaceae bacterium]
MPASQPLLFTMNLLRLLIIALAVWIIIVLIRNARARKQVSDKRPANKVENMVSCVQCGLHLPEKDAIRDGDHFFCSEQHRNDFQA